MATFTDATDIHTAAAFKVGDRVRYFEGVTHYYRVVVSVDERGDVYVGRYRDAMPSLSERFTRRADGTYRKIKTRQVELRRVSEADRIALELSDDYRQLARAAKDERRDLATRAYDYAAQELRRIVTAQPRTTVDRRLAYVTEALAQTDDDASILTYDVTREALERLKIALTGH